MKLTKKGFTLIELLIVITIIGILAVAFLPSLLGAPSKARDTQRITQLQKIATVLISSSLTGNLPAGAAGTGMCIPALNLSPQDFGGNIPSDPTPTQTISGGTGGSCTGDNAGQYLFVKQPGGETSGYSFGLYAHLENWENGNLVCAADGAIGTGEDLIAITDADEGTAETNPGDGDGTDATNCFAILIQ